MSSVPTLVAWLPFISLQAGRDAGRDPFLQFRDLETVPIGSLLAARFHSLAPFKKEDRKTV